MSFQQRNKQAHDASCRHGNLDGAESNYESVHRKKNLCEKYVPNYN